MSGDLYMPVFWSAWVLAVVYMACAFWLARRLNSERMRNSGYTGGDLLAPTATFKLLGFIFSDRHIALGDATVSRLTYVARALFVILTPLFLYVFASVWGGF